MSKPSTQNEPPDIFAPVFRSAFRQDGVLRIVVRPLGLALALLLAGCSAGSREPSSRSSVVPLGTPAASAGRGQQEACLTLPRSDSNWTDEMRGWRDACAKHMESDSCQALGWALKTGSHGKREPDVALAFLKCACARGPKRFCNGLATMYDHGHGVAVDHQHAHKLYAAACRDGNAFACSNLGVQFDRGVGASKDAHSAFEYYEKGCSGGDPEGCAGLGYLYDRGYGVTADLPRAIELYRKACGSNSPMACNNLGVAYQRGQGAPKDLAKARELYDKACRPDYAPACTNLGKLYLLGLDGAQDPRKAGEAFKRGCNAWQDYEREETCGLYARTVLQGFAEGISRDEAVQLLTSGCDNGVASSCVGLGQVYSLPPNQDIPKAGALFKRACDLKDAQGCQVYQLYKSSTGK